MAGIYSPIALAACAALLLSAAQPSAAASTAPAGESASSGDLCTAGDRQSPINIEAVDAARLESLLIRYKLSLVTLANGPDGLTASYGAGSYIEVGKTRFDLEGFRLRAPSEHRILGRRFPVEIQFMHRNAKGGRAVISVLATIGTDNLAAREIFERLPERVGGAISDSKAVMNARDLLPDGAGYIRYSGSLTEPPCSEDVDWFVMSSPVRFSEKQIERVRGAVGENARDVQPRNGRYLLKSAGM